MTRAAQIFFYVVAGRVEAAADSQNQVLTAGQFVYVPVGQPYQFKNATAGTQILTFHKAYEPLEGHPVPGVLFGEKDDSKAPVYLNDEALRIQVLLPEGLSFDMAVNIFTYQTGGNLPMVETHIMEHGLLYLQG